MRNPTFLKFFATLTLLVFTGCATATYQPPKIEGNRYTNYEYIYTVEIPDGWKTQKKLKKKLELTNDKTNGFIFISGERVGSDRYDYYWTGTRFPYGADDSICESIIDSSYPGTRFTVLASQCYPYSTELTLKNWKKNTGLYKPGRLLEVTYRFESSTQKVDGYDEIFPYPCQGKKTCFLFISLLSTVGTLDKNKVDFKTMVESLRVRDYTQNP